MLDKWPLFHLPDKHFPNYYYMTGTLNLIVSYLKENMKPFNCILPRTWKKTSCQLNTYCLVPEWKHVNKLIAVWKKTLYELNFGGIAVLYMMISEVAKLDKNQNDIRRGVMLFYLYRDGWFWNEKPEFLEKTTIRIDEDLSVLRRREGFYHLANEKLNRELWHRL